MLKIIAILFFYTGIALAQSSPDGMFAVQNLKSGSLLTDAQMREAEKLYQSACAVVKRDLHGTTELRPRFTVVIGADHDEVHGRTEIWLKQWNPVMFTEGVVVLAFDQVLTPDAIKQMGQKAARQVNATIDAADFRNSH